MVSRRGTEARLGAAHAAVQADGDGGGTPALAPHRVLRARGLGRQTNGIVENSRQADQRYFHACRGLAK